MTNNPKRPPSSWWDRCVQGVTKSGGIDSPERVCGSLWYHKMSAADKRRIIRGEKLEENVDTHRRGYLHRRHHRVGCSSFEGVR